MHLLGGAALFLTSTWRNRANWPGWPRVLLTALTLGLVASLLVRAALVGLAGCLALLLMYRMWRPILVVVGALVGVAALLSVLNIQFETHRGVVNAATVVERQLSTINFIGNGDAPAQDDQSGTIYWRVIWWRALWDEALGNPAILMIGRGYGPDLRQSVASFAAGDMNWDQGQDSGSPVRSPHNIAMTLLARSGLVGLTAWVIVLVASFRQIMRATLAARRAGDVENELLGRWFSIYLAVILLVSMFGVVLESPFGAIPFFWTLGMALAWAAQKAWTAASTPTQRHG
jgi:O-antigen ligase